MRLRTLAGILCASIVVLAAVAANQSAIHWRQNIADDHLYTYGGWRIWQGDRPYVDVWDNKPPGIWWLNALGFALCGEGIGGGVLAGSLALIVSILAFIGAARAVYGAGITIPALFTAVVLLTHVHYECGANRTETYLAAAECAAVCAYCQYLRSGSSRWLAVAGFVGGTAPLFKQNGVAAAAACALHLLYTVWRNRNISSNRSRVLFVYAACICAAPAAAGCMLLSQDALAAAWDAVVVFNRLFFVVGDATWLPGWAIVTRYAPELPPLYGVAAFAAAGAVLSRCPRRNKAALKDPEHHPARAAAHDRPVSGRVVILWIWFAAAAYLACVGSGRLAYHLAPLLAPLGLLALHPLAHLLHGRRLSEGVARRGSFAVTCVVYLYALWIAGADSVRAAQPCWGAKPSWHALSRRTASEDELRGTTVRAIVPRDQMLYVWGWAPGTYRFAYRRCPSRFATIEHASHVAPYGEFIVLSAMTDVQRNPPRAFVISISDLEGLRHSGLGYFRDWLDAAYVRRELIGGMWILERSGAGGKRMEETEER